MSRNDDQIKHKREVVKSGFWWCFSEATEGVQVAMVLLHHLSSGWKVAPAEKALGVLVNSS